MQAGRQAFSTLVSGLEDEVIVYEESLLAREVGPVQFTTVLRILPGRRVILKAMWQKQPVIVKIFFHDKKYQQDLNAVQAGFDVLKRAQLKTPECLRSGVVDAERFAYQITEYVPQEACYTVFDLAHFPLYLEAVLQMHQAGVIQTDPHLDNFLLTEQGVYYLDTGSIQAISAPHPLSKQQAFENLACILAQRPLVEHIHFPEWYRAYAMAAQWPIVPEDENHLAAQLRQAYLRRQRHYLKKIFRDCTEFEALLSEHFVGMAVRRYLSPQVQRFLEKPDLFLAKNPPGSVSQVILDGLQYRVRHLPSPRTGLLGSRARAQWYWHNVHLLQYLGIVTEQPVAFVLKKGWRGPKNNYFVVVDEPKPQSLEATFQALVQPDDKGALVLVRQIVDILETLLKAQLICDHSNISHWGVIAGTVCLLEVDTIRPVTSVKRLRNLHQKNIDRFLKSCENLCQAHQHMLHLALKTT